MEGCGTGLFVNRRLRLSAPNVFASEALKYDIRGFTKPKLSPAPAQPKKNPNFVLFLKVLKKRVNGFFLHKKHSLYLKKDMFTLTFCDVYYKVYPDFFKS